MQGGCGAGGLTTSGTYESTFLEAVRRFFALLPFEACVFGTRASACSAFSVSLCRFLDGKASSEPTCPRNLRIRS
jgi:hypothetical protein